MAISEALKKKAKKIWVSIVAPEMFRSREVGETNVYLPEQVLNKLITMTLSIITDDPKKQNMNVVLKVTSIRENKAITEMFGYSLVPSYLKRLNRMTKVRIEQSLQLKTKDGVDIIIKALALTKFDTKNSVMTAVRAKMKEFLITHVQNNNYNELMNMVVSLEFQKNMHKELKLIYPLSYVPVKTIKRVK